MNRTALIRCGAICLMLVMIPFIPWPLLLLAFLCVVGVYGGYVYGVQRKARLLAAQEQAHQRLLMERCRAIAALESELNTSDIPGIVQFTGWSPDMPNRPLTKPTIAPVYGFTAAEMANSLSLIAGGVNRTEPPEVVLSPPLHLPVPADMTTTPPGYAVVRAYGRPDTLIWVGDEMMAARWRKQQEMLAAAQQVHDQLRLGRLAQTVQPDDDNPMPSTLFQGP